MNIEELRRRLVECDRTALEYHYSFIEALVCQRRLVGYKEAVLVQSHLPEEVKHNLQLLDYKLMQTNKILEELRRDIKGCLDVRSNIERLLA